MAESRSVDHFLAAVSHSLERGRDIELKTVRDLRVARRWRACSRDALLCCHRGCSRRSNTSSSNAGASARRSESSAAASRSISMKYNSASISSSAEAWVVDVHAQPNDAQLRSGGARRRANSSISSDVVAVHGRLHITSSRRIKSSASRVRRRQRLRRVQRHLRRQGTLSCSAVWCRRPRATATLVRLGVTSALGRPRPPCPVVGSASSVSRFDRPPASPARHAHGTSRGRPPARLRRGRRAT